MTALVSMFSFLKLYLHFFTCLIFGGTFSTKYYSGDFHLLAYNIIESFRNVSEYSPSANFIITFPGNPYLYIPIGIFVIGACFGLARRLIRG